MTCEFCKSKMKCVETKAEKNNIFRKYKCKCGEKYQTKEIVILKETTENNKKYKECVTNEGKNINN